MIRLIAAPTPLSHSKLSGQRNPHEWQARDNFYKKSRHIYNFLTISCSKIFTYAKFKWVLPCAMFAKQQQRRSIWFQEKKRRQKDNGVCWIERQRWKLEQNRRLLMQSIWCMANVDTVFELWPFYRYIRCRRENKNRMCWHRTSGFTDWDSQNQNECNNGCVK